LNLNIKDKEAMNQKLKLCEEKSSKNNLKEAFTTTCQACGANVDFSKDQCAKCQHTIIFCFSTYLPIKDSSYFECSICESTFSKASLSSNPSENIKCALCKAGLLTELKVKNSPKSPSVSRSTDSKEKKS